MKRAMLKVSDVKRKITEIQGKDIKMLVNKGRKKMVRYEGRITNIYPSLFTVEVEEEKNNVFSYSYADVLCGNVRICLKNVTA